MSQLISTISRIMSGVSVEDVPFCRRVYNLSTAADVSAAVPGVPLKADSKISSQDVPREDNSALKTECNSEVVIKPSYQPDHMGEEVKFSRKDIEAFHMGEDFIWDPGTTKSLD